MKSEHLAVASILWQVLYSLSFLLARTLTHSSLALTHSHTCIHSHNTNTHYTRSTASIAHNAPSHLLALTHSHTLQYTHTLAHSHTHSHSLFFFCNNRIEIDVRRYRIPNRMTYQTSSRGHSSKGVTASARPRTRKKVLRALMTNGRMTTTSFRTRGTK